MRAYGDCLEATSTDHAPWFVVPADDKQNARLIVSQVVVDAMKRLKMRYPAPTPATAAELRKIRAQLQRESSKSANAD